MSAPTPVGAPTATAARVHVQEAGEQGPLLLCLHGIGSSSAAFADQLAELSAYVRVVAWDAPGYAASADPDEPLDLDGFADAAAEVIRARAADAHVLGVSWGGVIALRLAARHPDLVRSLIVADSSPGSGTDEAKAAAMRARADELATLGPRAFAESRGPRLVSPGAPGELVRRVVDTMASSVRLPGYGYAAESMASADLRAELPGIAAPTLVICGEHDTVTGIEAGQAIAGAIHRTAYVIVKDAGHLANQEQPRAFDAWVLSHLRITDRIPEHIARSATEQPSYV
ncbi:alpha/beta fold hydrolase [Streptomyces triticagri]|uniref:Alpha/beta fold hydrolase n=1 Tax=Streptomyces triticagri TaxID=2293568 RepID=A0A372M8L2_9ACTN|nr:alpha/beta fold hydrolase [Streptomyces triticagri]RFU87221.1 alpha/beta fold hydrolase [Streptomyces triticagri]